LNHVRTMFEPHYQGYVTRLHCVCKILTWSKHGSNMVRTWYYRGYARAHFGHILGTFWAHCARLEQNINRAQIARTKPPPGRRLRAARFGPRWPPFWALHCSHRLFAPLLQALVCAPKFSHPAPPRDCGCRCFRNARPRGVAGKRANRARPRGVAGARAAGRGVKIWVHKQGLEERRKEAARRTEREELPPARPKARGARPPPGRALSSSDLGPINVLLQTRTVCPKCAQNVPKMCPRVTTIIPPSNHVRTMFGPCSNHVRTMFGPCSDHVNAV
jgi:hypothetical protein